MNNMDHLNVQEEAAEALQKDFGLSETQAMIEVLDFENRNTVETIVHNNQTYTVDYAGDGEAKADYIQWTTRGHDHIYAFQLHGAHEGQPIDALLINPRPDFDEGSFSVEWDKLLWADDESPILDDAMLDSYTDALGDEMKEVIRETWD